jgi:hypothetical protein
MENGKWKMAVQILRICLIKPYKRRWLAFRGAYQRNPVTVQSFGELGFIE